MLPLEEMPNGREEECSACGYETEEEHDDRKMLLIHEMATQAGATVRDTAIGELDIESSEGRGNAFNEEGVQEADGCVPILSELS